MEQQNIKQVLVWVGIGVAAAAVVLAIIFGGKLTGTGGGGVVAPAIDAGTSTPVTVETANGSAKVYAPGSSAVTDKGEVIAPSGKIAKNNALPGAGDSPQESYALKAGEVPQGSLKISISDSAFSPAEFSVSNGKPVILTFTSTGADTSRGVIVQFEDPSLSGLIVSLLPGETKALTFSAPEKTGDYSFYRKGSSARGVMHVK